MGKKSGALDGMTDWDRTWADARGKHVSPSIKAKKETSSPVRHSSTTTSEPGPRPSGRNCMLEFCYSLTYYCPVFTDDEPEPHY